MRTTGELIQELDQGAGNFTGCGLVIGFEATTIYVWGNDPDRWSALEQAVDAGGKAIGLLAYDMHNGLLTVNVRAFEEYATEDWAADYLDKLADNFRQSILETVQAGKSRILSTAT